MRIVCKQLSTGDVDLFDHALLVEAGVADRRKVVQIRVPHTGVRQLLLSCAQFAVLNLEFRLVNLKFFDQVLRSVILHRLQRGKQLIRRPSKVHGKRPTFNHLDGPEFP